jgi:spermidine synthase
MPVTLAALFFLSGICGLVYQTLWLRLLSLVFGVTIYAASTVLASFMGGLALGTMAAGRLSGRVRSPLAWFGATEIAIGLAALATPPALEAVASVWVALQARLPEQAWALTVARFLCSAAVLVVPTSLMGATLPLVVRSSLARGSLVGPRVGLLYAANTGGAIAGALLTGFVLIGAFGIATTFRLAAALNTFVGLSALALSARRRRGGRPDPTGELSPPAPSDPGAQAVPGRPSLDTALVPVVFAVSGFAALALEVVWLRMLVLFTPATTYAFTTMLAAVLLGIALGSAAAAPFLRRTGRWTLALGAAQILTGLLAVAALAVYLAWYQAERIRGSAHVMSLVAVLPPAVAMGLAFPIGIRAWTGPTDDGRGGATRVVARLYAINVGGAIAGAVAAGFLLVPWLGSRGSLLLLAGLYVVSGLVLVAAAATRRVASLAGLTVAVAFAWLAATLPSPFRAVEGRRVPPGERALWLEEGKQSTVGVYTRPMGGRVLYLDGLHQANDSASMVQLHRQIGLLAMALHPSPKRALVIGLGGGVTAGAASLMDGATVDVVELSDTVVRAAAWFRHVNHDVLRRPNVRLRVDDGRNYLLTTRERYDVITADIIQPIHAGAGSLYSREYFRLARRALADGGLMLQWIGERPRTHYLLIMRTFLDAFPETTLWVGGQLMIGAAERVVLDPAGFERKLSRPGARRALEAIGIRSFADLQALYTAGPDDLRAFVGPGPVLTDDRPLVEYHRSLPADEPLIDLRELTGKRPASSASRRPRPDPGGP